MTFHFCILASGYDQTSSTVEELMVRFGTSTLRDRVDRT